MATFSDPGSPDPASAFTATVDWGDGVTETSAANPNDITVTGGAGNYTVTGTHTYADEFSGDINVTVSEGAFTLGPNPDSITVAEGDTLTPINNSNVSFPENAAESGFVARFSDTYTGNVASDFTATIDWGDGTSTTGVIPTGGAGSFTVSGGHTYADEGVFTITTVLTDDAPGTASATSSFMVTVTEADTLAAASVQPNVTLTESATTSGAIAVFSDAGYPNNSASDFSATIDWGDGATTAGTVSSAGAGNFTVSGSHAYADEGSFTATVVLTDDAPGTDSATASSTVTVLDADTLSATATPVFAAEGTPFTNAIVATFSDTDASNTAGDFTATILWGDGTSSTGSVSGAAGAFTVTGSHTYFDEGVFTPTVFVADDAPGTASASAVGTATVADNDTLSGSLAAISTTEGSSFSGTVATFTDTTYPSNPATDFTATIDWGDGTTTSGTILGAGGGTFSVGGSHAYTDEGSFTVSVTLSDDAPGTATATASGTASVAEGDFGSLNPATITPTEGTAFSGAVASFTDPGNPSQTAGDFTATIDWGDGTTTAGTVSGATGGPFTIGGSHTYADEGTFAVIATFSDDPPSTLTDIPIFSTAEVSEGDVLSQAGSQPSVAPTEGTAFSGAVAVFSDTGYPNNSPADFTATIDWGDGTTDTGAAVTVTGSGNGFFTVSGSHTYADEGAVTAAVTLTDVDDDGSGQATASATASVTVNVADGDTLTGTLSAVAATEGTAFSGTVATFTDTYTGNTAADFTATIHWGDGTTTAGTVSGSAGSFTVSGSHTYADEGSFTAAVVLTDDAPGTASATASNTIAVAEGDVLTVNLIQPTPSATEGQSFSGRVANFVNTNAANNTPADFTATIKWGDGTTTTGTVSNPAATNIYAVDGSHTYADEGTFTVTVVLSDDAPGTASATASNPFGVAEADSLSGTATPIQTTEGTAVSEAATFTDTYTGNTAADFTATINWGDGTTTAGTVSGGGGSFTVSGSHIYTASGSFPVAVTLADDAPGTASNTATTTASVSGDVVVPGTNGNDTLSLFEAPGGGVGSIIYVLDGGAPVTLTGVQSFTFDGLGGDDTMIVDCINGKPLVPGGVFYDGGTGSNTLTLDADGLVVRTVPGALTIADPVTVQYANTQAININAAAAVNAFAGPDTADRDTAFAGLNAQERFVQSVYLDELGRAGSKAELDLWTPEFNSGGTQTQAQAAIASGIQDSAEARDHLVQSWYLTYLGRAAQGGEENGWVGLLSQGQSEEQVLSQILASQEFYNRAQALIPSGSADERYVQALYLLLLNRTGAPTEADAWVAALPTLGRQGAALSFLSSAEFRTDDFEGYYNALLNRPGDQPALNDWVFSSLDVAGVRVGFESTLEFFVDG